MNSIQKSLARIVKSEVGDLRQIPGHVDTTVEIVEEWTGGSIVKVTDGYDKVRYYSVSVKEMRTWDKK